MQKILQGSLIYRLLATVWAWFGTQWRSSRVMGRFLSPGWGERTSGSSALARAILCSHRALCVVFDRLRLSKLLHGSIFTKPFIWCFATLALAPVLPTMVILLFTLACVGSFVLALGCDREHKPVCSPAGIYIGLYAFVYIAATFTSVTVSGSLLGGALTTLFVLFPIVLQNSVTTRRQLDALIYAFVIAGTFISAYGIYQYFTGVAFASAWFDSTMFAGISTRVYSTLGNPNVLATYLLLVIPFAGACIFMVKRPILKLFFVGCLCVMLACMALTFSRGGWLGLIIAAAVFLVILDRRFIIVGIFGLVFLYFALPDVVVSRFTSIGDFSESSTSYRVSIWLGTISMLRDFWFTGIGPGTEAFNRIYPLYSYSAAVAWHSHNLYLQIMCDAGIIGIVVFAIIIFTYFRNLCTSVSKEPDKSSKILQIAAISSVSGFLVQGVGDYLFYNYRVTLVFWAVLGLGLLIARRGSLKGEVTVD